MADTLRSSLDKKNKLLHKKIVAEYETFITAIKKSPPDTLVQEALKLTIMRHICDVFETIDLTEAEMDMLLAVNPLAEKIFQRWMQTEYNLAQEVRNATDALLAVLEKGV